MGPSFRTAAVGCQIAPIPTPVRVRPEVYLEVLPAACPGRARAAAVALAAVGVDELRVRPETELVTNLQHVLPPLGLPQPPPTTVWPTSLEDRIQWLHEQVSGMSRFSVSLVQGLDKHIEHQNRMMVHRRAWTQGNMECIVEHTNRLSKVVEELPTSPATSETHLRSL